MKTPCVLYTIDCLISSTKAVLRPHCIVSPQYGTASAACVIYDCTVQWMKSADFWEKINAGLLIRYKIELIKLDGSVTV